MSPKAPANPRRGAGDESWEGKDHLAEKSSKQQLLIRLTSIFNMQRAALTPRIRTHLLITLAFCDRTNQTAIFTRLCKVKSCKGGGGGELASSLKAKKVKF